MTRRPHVVHDPSELGRLASLPLLRPAASSTIRLGGQMADHPERERWEREIDGALHACGCDTGATGLLFSLAAATVLAVLALASGAAWWMAAGLWLALGLAGGLAGKLIGLRQARVRLRETIEEIRSWNDAGP
jgi:hypothetical protein